MPYRIRGFKLDDFTGQYLATALWAETVRLPMAEDDLVDGCMDVNEGHVLHGIQEGTPLDFLFNLDDFTDNAIGAAIADCTRFQEENTNDLRNEDYETAGHDFWLTRNGHGAGFWDGDYDEDKGKRLTDACKDFGECNIWVNENGTVEFDG